ncbi:MAG: PHP domain-containing protein, partial [Lachnospiraceae bacterium]|nr:PHP domain-containing protein [Lachnospiraceae bacterium]
MEKPFLEVFPGLHIGEELKELLKLVMVERIAMPKDRSSLRIYIVSPRLIHKKNIYSMEDGIAKQLFPGRPLTVKIQEKYRLSAQYTPKKLYDVYKDSILLEFKQYGMIEHNILRKGNVEFLTEDTMLIKVEDNLIYRERSREVGRVLEKIFVERCGLPAEVRFEFIQVEKEKNEDLLQPFGTGFVMPHGYDPVMDGPDVAAMAVSAADVPWDTSGPVNPAPFPSNPAVPAAGDGAGKKSGKAKAGADTSGKSKAGEKKEFTKKSFGSGSGANGGAGGEAGFKGKEGGFKRDGFKGRMPYKKSENPDVLFGRDFEGEITEIREIAGEIGEVTIRGQILTTETRELKSGRKLTVFDITDFTDSITIKLFLREDQEEDAANAIKKGAFIRLKGITTIDKFDGELTIGSIVGIKKCEDFTSKREDNAPVKRVELHCHTKMSDMDGVSEVKSIIKRAKKWGMPAIAVTDHGCVQAFPDASHALDKGDTFKVIYGVEGYLVDDMKDIVENSRNQSLDGTYVVFDIETTGFSPTKNKIIEIGAVKVTEGVIVDRFNEFINPEVPIPFEIERLTGINDSMVMNAPTVDVILPRFLEFVGDAALVAHNASLDVSFISHNANLLKLDFDPTVLDTVTLARTLLPNLNRYKLDTVAKALNISLENHHRAVDDAEATAGIFVKFIEMLKTQYDMAVLDDLKVFNKVDDAAIMKMPTH